MTDTSKLATLTLGGGCFWCTEALYQTLDGVHSVTSGYAGGHVANPTYKQVTSATTGHAEVIRISYDPAVISLRELVDFFWEAHDPTTLNRQGADVGPQYRSILFYANEEEKQLMEASKAAAQAQFPKPIVTEIVPDAPFYPAEGYHQDFYADNRDYPYCQVVITPKLEKLQKKRAAKASQ